MIHVSEGKGEGHLEDADLDSEHGWSPERCRKLGAANLDAMLALVDRLR